jgi:thiamine pyrophosphate-dependent acetolactate synthase large subunit-like protein
MRVYEVVAEALLEQGVTTVFSLMTSDNMSMLGHLETKGVRIVRARTEYGAVCMADGYARETGDVGVVSIGAGPSAAMTGTALVTARKRRSPLVVIAGDTPPAQRHHLKHFAQHQFFEVTAGHCISAVSARGVVPDTHEVFRRARGGLGPSVLNLPVDLLESAIDYTDIADLWRFMCAAAAPLPAAADAAEISRAASLLADAQRPVIIAGRGATDDRCRKLMLAIGERIGALYGSSLQGQYLFDSAYDVGVIGTLGTSSAVRAMTETDCALVVGASLNAYTGGHGQLFQKAKIIQIDSRADAFGAETPVDLALCGDAGETLAALDALLDPLVAEPRPGFRSENIVAEIADDFRAIAEYEPTRDVLDQRLVLDALSRSLPARRRVVVDAGHFAFFVVDHVRLASPVERIWTADFASIGLAISVGIGVAAAAPDHATVVFVGDGGFAMSLPELDTAVRHNVPITFVVLDDGAYGAEVRYLENRRESDRLARFDSPNWADIARGYGCAAVTVRTREDLDAACAQLGRTATPLLLDIKVDSTVANRQFRGRTTSAAGAE